MWCRAPWWQEDAGSFVFICWVLYRQPAKWQPLPNDEKRHVLDPSCPSLCSCVKHRYIWDLICIGNFLCVYISLLLNIYIYMSPLYNRPIYWYIQLIHPAWSSDHYTFSPLGQHLVAPVHFLIAFASAKPKFQQKRKMIQLVSWFSGVVALQNLSLCVSKLVRWTCREIQLFTLVQHMLFWYTVCHTCILDECIHTPHCYK